MTFFIKTFGCKLNQDESLRIRAALETDGHVFTPADAADVHIVNSCTVTARSDAKLRKYISRVKAHTPSALLLVTGCYATMHADDHDEGVHFIPNDAKNALPSLVSEYAEHGVLPETLPATHRLPVFDSDTRSRAFLKIQDGCDVHCAYCIVWKARGPSRSVPKQEVLDDVRTLLAKGYREVVFTGINIGAYNDKGTTLVTLAHETLALFEREGLAGKTRLRFSSIEPVFWNDALIALFRNDDICAHAHIPLQSASDIVLARMGRRYTQREFLRITDALVRVRPRISLTTDVMAGHPGEDDAAFDETRRVCEDVAFAKMHVFRYSQRPGTRSASADDQVAEPVKKKRAKTLATLDRALHDVYRKKMIGKEMRVIVESAKDGKGRHTALASEYLSFSLEGKPGCAPTPRTLVGGVFTHVEGAVNVLTLSPSDANE